MKKTLILLSMVVLSACSKKYQAEQPTIIDNPVDLAARMTSQNASSIDFITLAQMTSSTPKFQHLADISSPIVGGYKTKATSMIKLDNRIYITYNTEGPVVAGGVDVVDISNLYNPVLVSSWQSTVYEFNDIKSKGRALYLAGAKKDVGAVVVVVDFASGSPVVVNELLVKGQVATSIDVRDDRLFVSSALGGGITRYEVSFLDVLNPTYLQYNAFPNALFVKSLYNPYESSSTASLEPMILGGDDTHLYFMDKELPLSVNPSVAPSRFITQGPLVYMNTSASGLKITEISKFYDGRGFEGFVSSLSLPGTGNGIAHMDQKLYVARGESGIRYVNVDEPGAPVEVGYFDFADGGSSNNVWVERYAWTFKVIGVADGLGGVRLVLEDTTAFRNGGDWIQVYAKGTPAYSVNPVMGVYVNGILVSSQSVSSSDWKIYHVNLPYEIPFGADVRIRFANDDQNGLIDDRNLSIGYVKIGDDYYYPWWNNYFSDLDVLYSSYKTDNLILKWNGYIKLIR